MTGATARVTLGAGHVRCVSSLICAVVESGNLGVQNASVSIIRKERRASPIVLAHHAQSLRNCWCCRDLRCAHHRHIAGEQSREHRPHTAPPSAALFGLPKQPASSVFAGRRLSLPPAHASTSFLFLEDARSPATLPSSYRFYTVDAGCASPPESPPSPWAAERSRSRPSRTTATAPCK